MTDTVDRPFAHSFAAYAARNERVVCLTNDLTTSCEADVFRGRFPDRYFPMGMAEQNIAGVLSGFAREGMIPVYPSFAVFATRRPYEQIAMNIAYPALPVRLFGFLPGLSTPGGVTHQSIDDLALMSVLPNMTVLEVGDATDIETIWDEIDQIPGPVYCRMLRGAVPRLFDEPFRVGELREITPGDEVLVISTGLMTEKTMRVVELATQHGVRVRHLHLGTIKPFPEDAVAAAISAAEFGVVTVENHLRFGGLGTAVADVIAERALARPLARVAVADTWATGGDPDYLFDRFGLGANDIIDALSSILPFDRIPADWSDGTAGSELTRGLSAAEAL